LSALASKSQNAGRAFLRAAGMASSPNSIAVWDGASNAGQPGRLGPLGLPGVLNRFGGAVGQSVASAGLLDHFLIVLVILAAVFYIRE
jgi:hypothetical protein